MCEADVVVSDISQAGKNLCEGSNDEVLAVLRSILFPETYFVLF